jgi:hypothetical protein
MPPYLKYFAPDWADFSMAILTWFGIYMCLPSKAQAIENDDIKRTVALCICALFGLTGVISSHYERLSQDADHKTEIGSILYAAGHQATSSQMKTLIKQLGTFTAKKLPKPFSLEAKDLVVSIGGHRVPALNKDRLSTTAPIIDSKNLQLAIHNTTDQVVSKYFISLIVKDCKLKSTSPDWHTAHSEDLPNTEPLIFISESAVSVQNKGILGAYLGTGLPDVSVACDGLAPRLILIEFSKSNNPKLRFGATWNGNTSHL